MLFQKSARNWAGFCVGGLTWHGRPYWIGWTPMVRCGPKSNVSRSRRREVWARPLGWTRSLTRRRNRPAVLRAVRHDVQDALGVRRLLRGIRTVYFPGERDQGYGADRTMICECMHHGLLPVITSNVNSVSHDVLNEWARDWIAPAAERQQS